MGTNRFTNLSTSQFDPLSWDEVSRVPLAKRTQHAAAQTAAGELETAAAQLDSLPVHDARAREIQEHYRNKIDALSETLASEGINQNTTQDVMRLNSEFKSDFSPLGDAGRIMKAKEEYTKQKADYYKAGYAKGHSGEYLDADWTSHAEKYTNKYGEDSAIENISSLGAGQYFDVDGTIQDEMSKVGKIMEDYDIQGDYKVVVVGGVPTLQSVTNGGKDMSNNSNLNAKLKELYDRFTNQNFESGRFASKSGFSSKDIENKLNNALGAYTTSASSVSREVDAKIIPQGKDGAGKTTSPGPNTVYGWTGADMKGMEGVNNLEDAKNAVANLESSADPVERASAQRHKKNLTELQVKHKKTDKNYIASQKLLNGDGTSPGLIAQVTDINDKNGTELTIEEIVEAIETGDLNAGSNLFAGGLTPHGTMGAIYDENTGTYTIQTKTGSPSSSPAFSEQFQNGVVATGIPATLVEQMKLQVKAQKEATDSLDKAVKYDRVNRKTFNFQNLAPKDKGILKTDMFNFLKNGHNDNKILEFSTFTADKDGRVGETIILDGDNKLQGKDEVWKRLQSGQISENDVEFKGFTPNSSFNGLPMAEYTVKYKNEADESITTSTMSLQLDNIFVTTANGTELNVDSTGGAMISKFETYGGLQGKVMAKRMRQQVKYQEIGAPSFTKNYEFSTPIAKLMSPNLKSAVGNNAQFDFDLLENGEVALNYISNKIGESTPTNLSWNHLIGTSEKPGEFVTQEQTKQKIQSLSPAMTAKLVADICKDNNKPVSAFETLDETAIDASLLKMAQVNEFPITSSNHYDLLDLIQQM